MNAYNHLCAISPSEVLGLVYVEGVVRGPTGREEKVDFLVDSGATYTLTPKEVWTRLELKPLREHVFILVDDTKVIRKLSECYIILPQGEGHTPVILGGRRAIKRSWGPSPWRYSG